MGETGCESDPSRASNVGNSNALTPCQLSAIAGPLSTEVEVKEEEDCGVPHLWGAHGGTLRALAGWAWPQLTLCA